MDNVLLVGLGGFLGSITRFFLGASLKQFFSNNHHFSTLLINLIGSLIIGMVFAMVDMKEHPRVFMFLVMGILGGFTTFSAFSVESLLLIEKQMYVQALTYIALSVVGGILLCALGMFSIKHL